LKWIENLFENKTPETKHKPVILSIAPADPVQLGEMMEIIQQFRRTLSNTVTFTSRDQVQSESEAVRPSTTRTLAVELNTSCPNIPGHPPPAYDIPTLTQLLLVLTDAYQSDPTLKIGLKLAPYVYRAQMENIVKTISGLTDDQGRNPIAFLTCTNTLGGCVMFADQVKETPGKEMVRMGEGKEGREDKSIKMALPTTFGGLAGEPLHFLSVG
jgi:dihydroorotate dehydrogenase (fumarate)